ncbi:ATP-binding protein [Microbispora sp. ATCC PTA-5024]|uniref:ATP-binding protein n=1 Tax=Microbispora sp. ATCC PTA-5024 TaxID=316330 RepID=UPI0003DC9168|nr:ATP-binding protein [Microbispora sp. ATCC PTA-5024]ETK33930.1 hypothetical protein MPTA5024_22110 [Microbispora sp. ATCC PTA-5024]
MYRLTQEALTNVARHAPGAYVRVRIVRAEHRLSLDVTNGAPAYRPAAVTHGGHGLTGMAERVAACGGTFRAAPLPDGGFHVSASIPLEASS